MPNAVARNQPRNPVLKYRQREEKWVRPFSPRNAGGYETVTPGEDSRSAMLRVRNRIAAKPWLKQRAIFLGGRDTHLIFFAATSPLISVTCGKYKTFALVMRRASRVGEKKFKLADGVAR
jgi:hypothetical protein